MLPEHNLGVEAGLKIITTGSGHILNQHGADFTSLDVRNHALPCRSFKVAAAPSVVRVVDAVGKAMLGGIVLQISFLIDDGVAVAGHVIVAGQSLV